MNDVNVYWGRWGGGVPNQKNAFHTPILHFEPGVVRFSLNAQNSSAWDRNHKKRPQGCSFNGGPLSPPPLYLGRHWRQSHDKMDQASPLSFKYCKRSKTGPWEQGYSSVSILYRSYQWHRMNVYCPTIATKVTLHVFIQMTYTSTAVSTGSTIIQIICDNI